MKRFVRQALLFSLLFNSLNSIAVGVDSTSTGAGDLGVNTPKTVYPSRVVWDSGVTSNTAPVEYPGVSTWSYGTFLTNRLCPPLNPIPLVIASAPPVVMSTSGNQTVQGKASVCIFLVGKWGNNYGVYYTVFSNAVNINFDSSQISVSDYTPSIPYITWELYCLPSTDTNIATEAWFPGSLFYTYVAPNNAGMEPAISSSGYGLLCN